MNKNIYKSKTNRTKTEVTDNNESLKMDTCRDIVSSHESDTPKKSFTAISNDRKKSVEISNDKDKEYLNFPDLSYATFSIVNDVTQPTSNILTDNNKIEELESWVVFKDREEETYLDNSKKYDTRFISILDQENNDSPALVDHVAELLGRKPVSFFAENDDNSNMSSSTQT